MLKYNVIIKEVEPLKVASVRDIIPTYSEQGLILNCTLREKYITEIQIPVERCK